MNRRIYRGTMCYSDMRKLLFVCHGNICRSPMAATLMRVMANAAGWGDSLWVDSCGVSDEEEGNPMDRRAVATLLSHGIRPAPHEARRFSKADYAAFDDILCMEERNRRGLLRLSGGDPEGKIHLLLDYTDHPRDVVDPWYTGDFEATWQDVLTGCQRLIAELMKNRPKILKEGYFNGCDSKGNT